jgi:hypothetical protein
MCKEVTMGLAGVPGANVCMDGHSVILVSAYLARLQVETF